MKKLMLLSVCMLVVLAGCGNTTKIVANMSGMENTEMTMSGSDVWMMMKNDDSGSVATWEKAMMINYNNDKIMTGSAMTGTTGMIKNKPEAYNFNITNCDKYVKLMECVIDKIPSGKRTDTISQYEQVIKMRKWFSGEDLKGICDQTIDSLNTSSGSFKQIGCNL